MLYIPLHYSDISTGSDILLFVSSLPSDHVCPSKLKSIPNSGIILSKGSELTGYTQILQWKLYFHMYIGFFSLHNWNRETLSRLGLQNFMFFFSPSVYWRSNPEVHFHKYSLMLYRLNLEEIGINAGNWID